MTRALAAGPAAACLIALALLASSAPVSRALAEGEVCRRGSQEYLPDQTACFEGITHTCQDNGAWVSDPKAVCVDQVYRPQSCHVSSNRSAAQGVRACIRGKRSLCNEGTWVDLGERC